MKAEVEAALIALGKVAREDIAELRDAVAQIDHKAGEAWHAYTVRDEQMMRQAEQIAALEKRADAIDKENAAINKWIVDEFPNNVGHSRRVDEPGELRGYINTGE